MQRIDYFILAEIDERRRFVIDERRRSEGLTPRIGKRDGVESPSLRHF